MGHMRYLFLTASLLGALYAQSENQPAAEKAAEKQYTLDPGTRIPMTMLNSISTKHAMEGDRVYLETLFPSWSTAASSFPRAPALRARFPI